MIFLPRDVDVPVSYWQNKFVLNNYLNNSNAYKLLSNVTAIRPDTVQKLYNVFSTCNHNFIAAMQFGVMMPPNGITIK